MRAFLRRPRFAIVTLSLFASGVMLQACSREAETDQAPAAKPATVGTTTKYDWYMQGTTPAGHSIVTSTGDGRITNESFVHWNNREYSIDSEVQLDSNGMVVAQRMTGISPFKSPIDESFELKDGVATWSTVGDRGSATLDEPAFYIDNEMGSFETMPGPDSCSATQHRRRSTAAARGQRPRRTCRGR